MLVIDKRSHIDGNAFDEFDDHGVLVHRYGPHLFHTQSRWVFAYLSRFTTWRRYEHRVQALVDGCFHPVPVNRTTINGLWGLQLDERGVADYLAPVRANIPTIFNAPRPYAIMHAGPQCRVTAASCAPQRRIAPKIPDCRTGDPHDERLQDIPDPGFPDPERLHA